MSNKINHLLDTYRALEPASPALVLATIIETYGSTYRKAGARMLIASDGAMIGLLGGGCFERDLAEQARSVFDSGIPKLLFYDMRAPDDVIWGLGLGCNGAVRILLQLLEAKHQFSPLDKLTEIAATDTSGVLATVCESGHPNYPIGTDIFLPTPLERPPKSGSIPESIATAAESARTLGKPHLTKHAIDGHSVKVFYDPIQPPPQLLILGAGADAVPLVSCAKTLGWRITVADYRPAHIKQERFPRADSLLCLRPEEMNETLSLAGFSAAVLMTHNIDYDARYLKILATANLPFIGLLGPAQRKDRLLQTLDGTAAAIVDRVFGPVGLDIGAETPEEIALSIMAGIQAALNARAGGQLNAQSVLNDYDDECLAR